MSERAKTTEEALKRAKENVMGALGVFDEQDGFDLVFECTGAEPCIQMSIHVSFSPIPLSLSLSLYVLPTSLSTLPFKFLNSHLIIEHFISPPPFLSFFRQR